MSKVKRNFVKVDDEVLTALKSKADGRSLNNVIRILLGLPVVPMTREPKQNKI
jgi:hypothetical protein